MTMYDLILKKRNKGVLTDQELTYIITEYTAGRVPDYQISALLMAIYFNGMTPEEATSLALIMAKSGEMLDLSGINGVTVDKHSTGGVGDKVSLVLAPMLAACGVKLAKMSGRGLGHTGGTIDKLESIPGFQVELAPSEFIDQVNKIGVSIIGQSANIAPADKKLYALRDVTATVDSIPLIAASIMSKKLASGAKCICLDVKCGSGAFMKNQKDAEALAAQMISIGNLAGRKMAAVITNMDEPLGHKIGNLLEVMEAYDNLNGKITPDLMEVCMTIGSILLQNAKGVSEQAARSELKQAVESGRAKQVFLDFVKAQHGDISVFSDLTKLLKAQKYELKSPESGYLAKFDTIKIGDAARLLGAGRLSKEDVLDMAVGIDLIKKIGSKVEKGETIAVIYHNEKGLKEAVETLLSSMTIAKSKPADTVLIEKVLR